MDRREFGRLLNLREEMIPGNMQNRPQTPMMPKSITVHNTSNPNLGADAAAHARFVTRTGFYMLNGRKNWVSWHYTVDDKETVKHLPLNEVALHAGRTANGESIAIEICMHRGIDQTAADLRAARLIAALLHDFGWSLDHVTSHISWTGKKCPTLLLDDGKLGAKWNAFLQLVGRERARIGLPPALVASNAEQDLSGLVEPLSAEAAIAAADTDIAHRSARVPKEMLSV